MSANDLYRIRPKSVEMIAESGEWGLFEAVFSIEKASDMQHGDNFLTISSQSLLPEISMQSEFVSIATAAELTNLSKKQLIQLCSNKKVLARKVKGKWMIQKESLEHYVQNQVDA